MNKNGRKRSKTYYNKKWNNMKKKDKNDQKMVKQKRKI